LYLTENWWRPPRFRSSLDSSERASSVRRMGPNSSSKRPGQRALRKVSSRSRFAGFATRRVVGLVSAVAFWS